MRKNIKFGDKVRDKLTGFEGTVIARIEYIYGCIQYQVQPSVDRDGKQQKHDWIDEKQLDIVKDNGRTTKEPHIDGGVSRQHP